MDESDKTIAVVICALLFGIGFFILNVVVYQQLRGKPTSSDDYSSRGFMQPQPSGIWNLYNYGIRTEVS